MPLTIWICYDNLFSPSMDGKVVRVLTVPLTHTCKKWYNIAFQHKIKIFTRVLSFLSSSNSMTFFFHVLFKFSKTFSLAVTLKSFKNVSQVVLRYLWTLDSSTNTNSGVYQNVCRLRWLITPFYLTLSLPCHLQ